MLTHRLVQALLLAVPATVALSGSVSVVQAAEECRSKPGPTAPSGSAMIDDRLRRVWTILIGMAAETATAPYDLSARCER
jgi:hypothetical protein